MSTDKQPTIDFKKLPSRKLADQFVEELMDFLFDAEAEAHRNGLATNGRKKKLHATLLELLAPLKGKIGDTENVANAFFERLNSVYHQVIQDAEFFEKADPAVECIEEVIIAYPGFYAIAVYRISRVLQQLNIPILPRLMSEYAHAKTGIDIHPGATIGTPFFIDHGTGVVIGQTSVIGNNVKIYQGVTLGALAVRKEQQGAKRHPTIEDNVIIYAGSCILGGDTRIGHDSVIGGNVWLTESVLPYSIVYHKSEVHIRDKSELKEVIDYVI